MWLACTSGCQVGRDLADLRFLDWPLLQQRNFKRDPNDPEKVERYQAEALIYRQAPLQALLGVVCNTSQVKSELEEQVARSGVQLGVHCRPQWYF